MKYSEKKMGYDGRQDGQTRSKQRVVKQEGNLVTKGDFKMAFVHPIPARRRFSISANYCE